jgi:outer membrane protein FlgP
MVYAIGFGAVPETAEYTKGQAILMAISASRRDALRSLAEKLYGVRITSATSLGAMSIKQDSFRVQLDAFIRGASVVSIEQIEDDIYQTVMQIDLTLFPVQ